MQHLIGTENFKLYDNLWNITHPLPLLKHPKTNTGDFNSAAKDGGPTSRSSCSLPQPSWEYLETPKGIWENFLTIWILNLRVIRKYLKRETFLPYTISQIRQFCNDLRIRNQVSSRPETARWNRICCRRWWPLLSPLQLLTPHSPGSSMGIWRKTAKFWQFGLKTQAIISPSESVTTNIQILQQSWT